MSRFDDPKHDKGHRMKVRKAKRGRAKMTPLAKGLAALSGVLALAALILLGNYLVNWSRMNKEQQDIRALYNQESTPEVSEVAAQPEITPAPEQTAQAEEAPPVTTAPVMEERASMADRFLPLMRRNQDVVGWLSYPMFSEMDFAVVQRDNEFYMDRAFSGERNPAGTVFVDETNSIRPRDKNLILHGHNMKNGTMFGRLARMMEPAVVKASPFITFDTLYQDSQYVPYAVTLFSVDPASPQYYDIIAPNFDSPEQMGDYVNWLRARSVLTFPVEVSAEDKLLTLVTCHGLDENERLVIALRAVRQGESTDALKTAINEGLIKN